MELDRLDHMYRDVILDHARSPRHHQEVEDPHVRGDAVNPFCGDEIHLALRLDGRGNVCRIGLLSKGCAICRASGSLLTEAVQGRHVEAVARLARLFREMMAGRPLSPAEEEALGPLEALASVREYPVRIKCALLPWRALESGLEDYRRRTT